MKNTLIPLDMIFIAPDGRIVGIVENAEPRTETPRRVDAPSQYVLEIGGGLSAKNGIRAGTAARVYVHSVAVTAPLRPMLATLAEAPLTDPNLVYEPKYDGIRALVTVTPRAGGAVVAIASRAGNDKTRPVPRVGGGARGAGGAASPRRRSSTARSSPSTPQGRPAGFQRLQDRMHLTGARAIAKRAAGAPSAFVAFDLLREGGEDLCPLPLAERRRRLEALLAPALGAVIRIADQVRGDGVGALGRGRGARLGGAGRQGRPLAVSAGPALARVAEAQARQAPGVRRRRVHRAAPLAQPLRRPAAGPTGAGRRAALRRSRGGRLHRGGALPDGPAARRARDSGLVRSRRGRPRTNRPTG